jgi:cold shock CspA family protein
MIRFGQAHRPQAPSGATRASGTIIRLVVGQSHGFIRLRDRREVFFHRADLREGTSFNSLKIGELVAFDLIADAVSGPRAISVTRNVRARGD